MNNVLSVNDIDSVHDITSVPSRNVLNFVCRKRVTLQSWNRRRWVSSLLVSVISETYHCLREP